MLLCFNPLLSGAFPPSPDYGSRTLVHPGSVSIPFLAGPSLHRRGTGVEVGLESEGFNPLLSGAFPPSGTGTGTTVTSGSLSFNPLLSGAFPPSRILAVYQRSAEKPLVSIPFLAGPSLHPIDKQKEENMNLLSFNPLLSGAFPPSPPGLPGARESGDQFQSPS